MSDKISVLIPAYNEEENIRDIVEKVRHILLTQLTEYDYEIVVIDNKSKDGTRSVIRELCDTYSNVKAIFNMKNFGQFNSPYYGILQCTGDCVITMCADFQDPPECIPKMVRKWEDGAKVVCMVKNKTHEGLIISSFRKLYYALIKKMSESEQIKQFTGFGLYDRSFVEVLRSLKDPTPFLRGVIAEYAPDHAEIKYEQPKRRAGKTHNNFFSLYDAAMQSFTGYTKAGLRIITFTGFITAFLSFVAAVVYLVFKLTNWAEFDAGIAPVTIGMFLIGGANLASLGFVGEYILSMNTRLMNRPLVIEEERLNFTEKMKGQESEKNK